VVDFKLPFRALGGVVRIYPGRCHWAELNCSFQGDPFPNAILPASSYLPRILRASSIELICCESFELPASIPEKTRSNFQLLAFFTFKGILPCSGFCPIFDLNPVYSVKVTYVFGYHNQTVVNSCGANKQVKII